MEEICTNCRRRYFGAVCPVCAMAMVRTPLLDDQEETPVSVVCSPSSQANSGPPETERRFEPGTMLGHFRIDKLLGEGGMGRVFEGQDTRLGRRVAIKIPKQEVLRSRELCAWFLQEGVSQARVKDHHVAQIYQAAEVDGIPCHIMEFVDGKSLAHLLKEHRRLPPERAVRIARDVALGLREIHLHGRIHGDVKPSNTLIAPDRAVIVDFGISRELTAMVTNPPAKGGTAEYQAPEAKRGDASGVSEDIYSLGCVLFEMLAGRAFSARVDRRSAAGEGRPPRTAEKDVYADVPRSLRDLVARLTASDRHVRPDSAKEVCQQLEAWLFRRRRLALRAVVIAAILVCLGPLVFRFLRPGQVVRLASNGIVVARHGTLDSALAALQDGETLELRTNGPFTLTTHVKTRREVTIRGASKSRPIVELAPSTSAAPLLSMSGGLTLDNVVIRSRVPNWETPFVLISCGGPRFHVKNCLWDLESRSAPRSVIGCTFNGGGEVQWENSIVVGDTQTTLRWLPEEKGSLSLKNCLWLGGTAIEYQRSNEPLRRHTAEIEHCTFCCERVMAVKPSKLPPPAPADESKVDLRLDLRLDANVFRTTECLIEFGGWNIEDSATVVMSAAIDWRESGNLYARNRDGRIRWRAGDQVSDFDKGKLTAWSRYWNLDITDFDALVVIGGNEELFFRDRAYGAAAGELLRTFDQANKRLYGIGFGTCVLASHGFLTGRQATVHDTKTKFLQDHGAEVVPDQPYVVSGSVLTISNPEHVRELITRWSSEPKIAVLLASQDYWGNDLAALSSSTTLLRISNSSKSAKPHRESPGQPIVPDVILPLLRCKGEAILRANARTWLESPPAVHDPLTIDDRVYAMEKAWLAEPLDGQPPGITSGTTGPGTVGSANGR